MSILTSHQLGTMFKKAFGMPKFTNCSDYNDILEVLFQDTENFRPPCYTSDTFVFSERVPIFADPTLKDSSVLCQALADRSNEVAIVADSIIPSFSSLHFVTMTTSATTIEEWLRLMRPGSVNIYAKNINDSDIVVISKLSSFCNR